MICYFNESVEINCVHILLAGWGAPEKWKILPYNEFLEYLVEPSLFYTWKVNLVMRIILPDIFFFAVPMGICSVSIALKIVKRKILYDV